MLLGEEQSDTQDILTRFAKGKIFFLKPSYIEDDEKVVFCPRPGINAKDHWTPENDLVVFPGTKEGPKVLLLSIEGVKHNRYFQDYRIGVYHFYSKKKFYVYPSEIEETFTFKGSNYLDKDAPKN